MTWIIIFGILLLVLLWLLFSPIYLYICTRESRYEAGMRYLIEFRLGKDTNGIPEIKARILFFRFNYSFYKSSGKKPPKGTTPKKGNGNKIGNVNLKTIWFIAKIVWKVYKSFKVKKFILNIDTGDVIRNAYLIPVFSFYFNNRVNLSVNYHQINELVFHTESRLFSIVYNIITIFIKHKLKK